MKDQDKYREELKLILIPAELVEDLEAQIINQIEDLINLAERKAIDKCLEVIEFGGTPHTVMNINIKFKNGVPVIGGEKFINERQLLKSISSLKSEKVIKSCFGDVGGAG